MTAREREDVLLAAIFRCDQDLAQRQARQRRPDSEDARGLEDRGPVCNIQVPVRTKLHMLWINLRRRRRPALQPYRVPTSNHRLDIPVRRDRPNLSPRLTEIHRPVTPHRDAVRIRDPRIRRKSPVTRRTLNARPGDRSDNPIRRYLPDPMIPVIRYIQRTIRAHRKPADLIHLRLDRRPSISRITAFRIVPRRTGNGRNDAARGACRIGTDLPDAMIEPVCKIERAVFPKRRVDRAVQMRLQRRPSITIGIAAIAGISRIVKHSRKVLQLSLGCDPPNVDVIADIHRFVRTFNHGEGVECPAVGHDPFRRVGICSATRPTVQTRNRGDHPR